MRDSAQGAVPVALHAYDAPSCTLAVHYGMYIVTNDTMAVQGNTPGRAAVWWHSASCLFNLLGNGLCALSCCTELLIASTLVLLACIATICQRYRYVIKAVRWCVCSQADMCHACTATTTHAHMSATGRALHGMMHPPARMCRAGWAHTARCTTVRCRDLPCGTPLLCHTPDLSDMPAPVQQSI